MVVNWQYLSFSHIKITELPETIGKNIIAR